MFIRFYKNIFFQATHEGIEFHYQHDNETHARWPPSFQVSATHKKKKFLPTTSVFKPGEQQNEPTNIAVWSISTKGSNLIYSDVLINLHPIITTVRIWSLKKANKSRPIP
jgi:hypothetical protein